MTATNQGMAGQEDTLQDQDTSYREVREYLSELNPEALVADGFEEALIGICYRFGQSPLATYDYDKCIEIITSGIEGDPTLTDDDDPRELAVEYFDLNVIGSWSGEGTPVFVSMIENIVI